jgi:hypothetical protein
MMQRQPITAMASRKIKHPTHRRTRAVRTPFKLIVVVISDKIEDMGTLISPFI